MTNFTEAQTAVKDLKKKPNNDVLLKLYALYKQSTEGDVKGKRPGGFDFVGGAKYDAWSEMQGKTPERAQQEYVALVEQLRAADAKS